MGLIPAGCLTAPCAQVSCGLPQEALVGYEEREFVFSSCFALCLWKCPHPRETCHYVFTGEPLCGSQLFLDLGGTLPFSLALQWCQLLLLGVFGALSVSFISLPHNCSSLFQVSLHGVSTFPCPPTLVKVRICNRILCTKSFSKFAFLNTYSRLMLECQ